MSLVSLGANFKTVPLDELERVSIPKEDIEATLVQLTSYEGINGAVALSTCNRVELYVDALTDRMGNDACRALLASRGGSMGDGYYLERGEDVARHLFRVVCSLDSQVLGEAQILGQAKDALTRAQEAGTCTETLMRLFKEALGVGKRVRTETAIGQDSVSLSTTAFQAASSEFDDISSCKVLFVGAGKMAESTLSYLLEAGVTDYLVTSRTEQRAHSLARRCNGTVVPFDKRYEALATVDLAFTMTSATAPVIEAHPLEEARKAANACARKLVLVDEAVPRDVHEDCAELENVVLHNLETLGEVMAKGMAARLGAIGAVELLVAQAEDSFLTWMQQRSVTPTIREMYAKGEAVVEAELARAVKAFEHQREGGLSDSEREILEAFGSSIMKKILHGPTARLRSEAETADSYYYTGAARYLFGLNTHPAGCPSRTCADKPCLKGKPCSKGAHL